MWYSVKPAPSVGFPNPMLWLAELESPWLMERGCCLKLRAGGLINGLSMKLWASNLDRSLAPENVQPLEVMVIITN